MVPGVPPGFVSRPRLLSVLDRVQDASVTLVSAPAGSGKTLLLAEWLRRRRAAATAWVALDTDDNDDRRFWSAILQAFAVCPAVPRDNPIRTQTVPSHPSADAGFLGSVVNALEQLPGVVRLVLDDVHELTDPAPLRGIEALLRHQPATLRLVLLSRYDPPLSLARLRLADQLAEIRADDLKFSTPEAKGLLAAAGVVLRPDQLARLVDWTEGWAAGLRLATISLAATDDPGRFLADFAENDRAVADYLIDEVLSRLPDDLREFLSTISVCDEVSAALARALSRRADAGAMLDQLERKTSLVARVGAKGWWYRVHALVRAYLLADLSRQRPARAAVLHANAADWFAAHGEPVRALAHTIQTGDADQVALSLQRQALSLALSGENDVLGKALAGLGDQVVADDSLLALVAALLRLEEGDSKTAELHLAHAAAAWPAKPSRQLETLRRLVRARHAQFTGDIDDMLRSTENLESFGGNEPVLDALAMLHRGTALLAAGRREAAGEQLRAALEVARETDQGYVALQCLTILAALAGTVGDFPLMGELAEDADREAGERGWQHTIAAATAGVLLAYGALLRGEPAECVRLGTRAGRLVRPGVAVDNPSLNLVVGTLVGTARFEMGDWAAGLGQIDEARLAGGDARFPADQVALTAVLEHRAAVRFGWTDAAREVVTWAQVSIPDTGEMFLMRARTQLAFGRILPAGRILRPLLDGSVAAVLPWSIVDGWLMEAELAHLAGEQARAHRALKKALAESRRLGVRYPLVFATPALVELLVRERGKLGELDAVAAGVLASRRALRVPVIAVPLTRRERSVLRLLPTLRSFEEIAQDLTVSPNTVKTHVRSIYRKLGVSKRRDAVTAALERGLLETLDNTRE